MDHVSRIVIVEEDTQARKHYESVVSSHRDCVVANTYLRPDYAVKKLRRDKPDIIFMDNTSDAEHSSQSIRKIKRSKPDVHVVVLSSRSEPAVVFKSLHAGASGYLLKSSDREELVRAIDEIRENDGAPMSPSISKMIVTSFQRNPDTPLSNRETEILADLASGKTYKDTADHLNIGLETVKSHVKNIYSKLEAATKSEAIRIARSKSLI